NNPARLLESNVFARCAGEPSRGGLGGGLSGRLAPAAEGLAADRTGVPPGPAAVRARGGHGALDHGPVRPLASAGSAACAAESHPPPGSGRRADGIAG